jgi:hypothetical protein
MAVMPDGKRVILPYLMIHVSIKHDIPDTKIRNSGSKKRGQQPGKFQSSLIAMEQAWCSVIALSRKQT